MNEPHKSLQTIFNEALEIEDSAQRAHYLAATCGADTLLLQNIQELIEANNAAGRFLGRKEENPKGPGPPPGATAPSLAYIEGEGDKIGSYKLLQEIGEGGCGTVYLAEQEEPVRRRVALKIIKLGMDTKEILARFEAERQALALMDHPNIPKVLDAGATATGRPYFVMELVKGVRITDFCDQHNLAMRDRLDLFALVCRAIQHAHQQGLIHRDIKPSNILVTLNDGLPTPKVIDFGIAKATNQRLMEKTIFTAFDQFMGTPAYMSPEQAEAGGADIDVRSDIYALGVLLYELLTGRPPFDGKQLLSSGLDAMRRIIREQEPAPPSTRLSALLKDELTTIAQRRQTEPARLPHLIRGDLDWIVMKCLEKDRARRYHTATDLADDVGRHLNNEPVVASPPSNLYRLQKLARRNKITFTAGATVLAVLLLGLFISSRLSSKAKKASERAAAAEKAQEGLRLEAIAARANETTLLKQAQAGDETEGQLREAVASARKLKPSDPSVLESRLHSLADFLDHRRRFAEAEPLYRELLVSRRARLKDGSAVIIFSTLELARLLVEIARADQSNPTRSQARLRESNGLMREFELAVRGHFTNSPSYLEGNLYNLAEAHFRIGNYAASEPLHREVLRSRQARLSPKNEDVLRPASSLAHLLSEWAWTEARNSSGAAALGGASLQRAQEAERLLRAGLAIRLSGTNATYWKTADTQSRLGFALVAVVVTDPTLTPTSRQAELAEAESLLLQGEAALRQSKLSDAKYKGDAITRLVRLYEAWNKPEAAAKWRAQLQAFE